MLDHRMLLAFLLLALFAFSTAPVLLPPLPQDELLRLKPIEVEPETLMSEIGAGGSLPQE